MPAFNKQYIFHPGNCINSKKPFASACRQCITSCPHGAVNEAKEVNGAKCTECGVCMAVCPSDGFVDRTFDELREYMLQGDEVTLNCPAAQPVGYEINCVGLLDRDAWSALMLRSGHTKVRVLTGDCGGCEDVKACAVGTGALNDLLKLWALPNNLKIEIMPWDGETVKMVAPSQEDKETIGEKREKGKLMDLGRKKLKSVLPSAVLAEDTYDITQTRLWLLAEMKKTPEKKVPFPVLKINEKCTSCGFCARVCPQGALTHTKEDSGVERFIYQPLLCCHCQRCMKICGPQAVTMEEMGLNARFLQGKILLHELVPRLCDDCGCQIYHKLEPGLCITCAKKDPELKGVLY